MSKLQSSKPQGGVVISAGVFEVSKHTDGTGFEGAFYNYGTKALKYITVSLRGLNALGDAVRGPLQSSTTVQLRGVGPVEPGESASYRKRYKWMTDIVQTAAVDSMKLEYMDGSSRSR